MNKGLGPMAAILFLALAVVAAPQTTKKRSATSRSPASKKAGPTAPRLHVNQLGGPTYPHSFMSPFGDWFYVLKPKPGQFSEQETFTLEGTLVREDGAPAADLTVWFFKLRAAKDNPSLAEQGEWVADIYLGSEDGNLAFINPKAKSDAQGRFRITMGPAWKEVRRAVVGFVVSASKEKPFDVHVLPILEHGKPLELEPKAEKQAIDLGRIVVEQKMPLPTS